MQSQQRGAGGTPGGSLAFFIGLIMASAGGYLLLSNIVVSSSWGLGAPLYRIGYGGGFNVTGGALLIPFLFGVGWIFYNARSVWGWVLACGALAAIIFGVLINLSISMRTMSLLDLIIILVLTVGGLGLFARSLRGS
jgi:lysozyme family protein